MLGRNEFALRLVLAKFISLGFCLAAKPPLHFLARPLPEKADAFSGSPYQAKTLVRATRRGRETPRRVRARRRETFKSVFPGDMRLGKNSSQPVSVRALKKPRRVSPPQRRNNLKFIFRRDMRVAKNTSRLSSVRAQRVRRRQPQPLRLKRSHRFKRGVSPQSPRRTHPPPGPRPWRRSGTGGS